MQGIAHHVLLQATKSFKTAGFFVLFNNSRHNCWSLVPKLEQDYLVVIYCIAIYLLADSII
jgi:hypothetical protein